MSYILNHRKNLATVATSTFLISILFTSVIPIQQVFATPVFGSTTAITTDNNSVTQQIASNGTNVYLVYKDANTGIGFNASSDNGATFTNNFELSFDGGTDSDPHVVTWGNNVYITWVDGFPNIAFAASTDGGTTFLTDIASPPMSGIPSPSEVSTDGLGSHSPRVAAYENNVYLTWLDSSNNVVFINSTDNGIDFSPDPNVPETPTQLSSGVASDLQITAVAGHVYVAYVDGGKITVDALEPSGSGVHKKYNNILTPTWTGNSVPQIATYGNNVYVVWKNSTNNIAFSKSTDGGNTFSGPIGLAPLPLFVASPQIAANSTNVYVTWMNGTGFPGDREIWFKSSTDSGTNFNSAINLSGTSGNSASPKISLFKNNVYVTWQDLTYNPTGADILFKSSSNNGAVFTSINKLTSTAGTTAAISPVISASGDNTYVSWEQDSAGPVKNIEFTKAVSSPIDVTFNAPQYTLSDTATITITDPADSALPSITAKVNSTSDVPGIPLLSLAATPPGSGIFVGSVTFGSSTSGTVLKADAGDTITALKSGQKGNAAIFPRVVQWDAASHDFGGVGHVIVTDKNSNLNSLVPETITVPLTSSVSSGKSIVLTETGANTGVFGSSSSDKVYFMMGNNEYPLEGTFTISHTDTSGGNPTIDCIGDHVSVSSGGTIDVKVNETSALSNVFKAKIKVTSGSSINDRQIHAVPGDIVTVQSFSPLGCIAAGGPEVHGLVIPNTDQSKNVIQVSDTGDTVTASYKGKTGILTVDNFAGPGGGSGGVLRASLVVDALASFSVGGSGSVAPSFSLTNLALAPNANIPANIKNEVLNRDPNTPIAPDRTTQFDFPLVIDGGGYPLAGYSNKIVTVTEKTNTPVDLKLNIPATNLEHLALYTNLHGTENDLGKSDTYIIYDKGQPLQIVDPHHYFDHVKFDMTTKGILNKIDYTITFANPMDKSNIIFRTWNDRHASSDVVIQNAWQVTEGPKLTSSSQLAPSQEQNIPIPQTPSLVPPVTSQGTPDIVSKIKDWGGYSPNPISDSELLSDIGIQGQSIPNWAGKLSKMVVDGDLTPQEFENALKYLASIGVVK